MDTLLQKKLLRPKVLEGQSRADRAAEEAVRAKRCIGSLRYLWRNSPSKAHHPSVMEMKSYLKESPRQRARKNDDDPVEPDPAEPASDDGNVPAGAVADAQELLGSDGNGDQEDGESETDSAEDDHVEMDESPKPEPEDSDEILRMPTLRLDDMRSDEVPFEEVEVPFYELPDSQREGAWMGRFYRDYKDFGEIRAKNVDGPKDCKSTSDDPSDGDSESDGPPDGAVPVDDPVDESQGDCDGEPLSDDEAVEPSLEDCIPCIIQKLGLEGYLAFKYAFIITCLICSYFMNHFFYESCLLLLLLSFSLRDQTVIDIQVGTQPVHNVSLPRHAMCDAYAEHCRQALSNYGGFVVGKLASHDHFNMWMSSQKKEEDTPHVNQEVI